MENLLMLKKNIEYSQPILHEAKLHWISNIGPIFLMLVGSIGFICIWVNFEPIKILGFALVFLFFNGTVKYLQNKYTQIYLTERYITIKTGIFSKNTFDLSLSKLEGMSLHQSFLGRFFNYGQLIISTGEISYSYKVENPMSLRSAIIDHVAKI